MHASLNKNLFLVKEHVGLFKAANNYDIHDPQTGEITMHCREDNLGGLTKLLRFTDYKRLTPFDVRITTPDGQQVVRITRCVTFLRSNVTVLDGDDQVNPYRLADALRAAAQAQGAIVMPHTEVTGILDSSGAGTAGYGSAGAVAF